MVHGLAQAIRRRWSRNVPDVLVDGRDVPASDGSLQSGRWRFRAHSDTGYLGRYRGTDSEVRRVDLEERGITEPSGGSDPAGSIQCRAVRDGDHYVLNGTKIFTSHAHEAEWGVVFTRTDPGAGRGGITAFIIEKGTPGFTPRPFKVLRTSALPNVVHFEDCRIPVAQRLGPEGGGLSLCMDLLTGLRFPYSACNVGIGVAALRMAIDHAKQRKTFGELLARRQAIQWMLADSEVELRAARWLIWDGAWKSDRKEDARMEASVAKLYSSEVLGRVVDRAVQIHGGYGVSKEFPLERWYREARIRRIGEGPSEVHRMVIARNLLR